MPFPPPTDEQIRKFRNDGYLVVEDVLDQPGLAELQDISQHIVQNKERLAYDWDWRRGEPVTERHYRIVQALVTAHFPQIRESRFRRWSAGFSSALMGSDMAFWYDQFLGKPPRLGAPTPWHQDEAYWGRRLCDRGITCWMSMHDVDQSNGCMHFMPGGHRVGMYTHRHPDAMASDLLVCDIGSAHAVACPLRVGSVTFHHSKMPHMTTGNSTDRWRMTMTQHFCDPNFMGEGDPYPWRVLVDQMVLRSQADLAAPANPLDASARA